jgi:hypothetical protein
METLTNWWRSLTGTTQEQPATPVVENASVDGVGGRKRRSKTRRGGKKSRKLKPRRK